MSSKRRILSERGQALVELALTLPLLLLVALGAIEFGKAFNYWIDSTHIANEGARWVVVAKLPGVAGKPTTIQQYKDYVKSQADTQELRDITNVLICFPNGTANGNPVTVRVTSNYDILDFVKAGTVPISSSATMRIEQPQAFGGTGDTGC
jgi:Flp pilus assembly protein TadG